MSVALISFTLFSPKYGVIFKSIMYRLVLIVCSRSLVPISSQYTSMKSLNFILKSKDLVIKKFLNHSSASLFVANPLFVDFLRLPCQSVYRYCMSHFPVFGSFSALIVFLLSTHLQIHTNVFRNSLSELCRQLPNNHLPLIPHSTF